MRDCSGNRKEAFTAVIYRLSLNVVEHERGLLEWKTPYTESILTLTLETT